MYYVASTSVRHHFDVMCLYVASTIIDNISTSCDVLLISMRRDEVATTSFDAMYLLGSLSYMERCICEQYMSCTHHQYLSDGLIRLIRVYQRGLYASSNDEDEGLIGIRPSASGIVIGGG